MILLVATVLSTVLGHALEAIVISAARLFEEVRKAGYTGWIMQVRDYVARVRLRPEPEPLRAPLGIPRWG